LLTGTGAFATTDECWQHVESSTAGVAVITLRDAAMLTPAFFASLNEKLQLDPSVNATLPSDPLLPTSGGIPPGWLMTEDEIRGAFPPTLRDKVFDARSAIEEYKNSGEAVVEKIKMARGELYHAYSFAFIRQVQDGTDPNAELAFTAGLRNMYRLIGKPFPVESSVIRASLAPVPSGSSLSIECSSTSLIFRGIARDTTTLSIESLSVILDSAVVSYRVNLSTSAWASAPVIDIYIDMNNQRGAGLTNLLPGPAAFLVEENGWELAIRMDRYQIALYRAGRGGPVLMKTFRVGRPYQVDIPRTVFRGNPLAWWYQAVVMVRGSVGEPWNILDFLSPTSTQKQRIFAKPPLQLPAIQYQNPQ
ncbi:MAG: hypothetical protein WCG51_05755, partial [Elusimicrobiota bacterium]